MFLLFALSIGGIFLVFNRLHFSSQDYSKLAHWIGNDLLRLDEDAPRPWIIGHRGSGLPGMDGETALNEKGEMLVEGGKSMVIGNTASAIQRAIIADVDWIEIDIRVSSDGTLVVFHDEKINPKTKSVGKVKDFSGEALQSLEYRVEGGERILTLEQTFDRFSASHPKWILDVKTTGIASDVHQWIKDKEKNGELQPEQVIIFGRRKVLKEFAGSEYDLGYVVSWGDKEWFGNRFNALFSPSRIVSRGEDLGCRYLVLPIIFSKQGIVDEAIAKGMEVWMYGSDARLDLEHAAARGISGIIVDDPESAVELFSDHPLDEQGE